MLIAQCPRAGVALAVVRERWSLAQVNQALLALSLLLAMGCNNEQSVEPGSDAPGVRATVTSGGELMRDNFTDGNGTLLVNHVPDGSEVPFHWIRGQRPLGADATIQDNGLKSDLNGWEYVASLPAGDVATIDVDVYDDLSLQGAIFHPWVFLRGDNVFGGELGYRIVWSLGGEGADAFAAILKFTGVVAQQTLGPPLAVGLHRLKAEVTQDGTISAYVDGSVVLSYTDPEPLPAGFAGMGYLDTGDGARITGFEAPTRPIEDSASVALRKEDVSLSPSELVSSGGSLDFNGQPVQTQVQLQVSVDSNGVPLPNRSVMLSVTAVDLAGVGPDGPYGHVHTGAGGAQKPAGTLFQSLVNTGPDGVSTVTYKTGPVAGPIVLRAESEGAKPKSDTLRVGVLGLVPLSGRSSYVLIGDKPWHPGNHWGVQPMVTRLEILADSFYATFNRPIWYNDMSLPLGGRFDVNQNWAGPHSEHRAGRDLDMRTDGSPADGGMTEAQRNFVNRLWRGLGGDPYDERFVKGVLNPNGPHYHLRYRGF